jgi:hypothetical protein
LQKLDSAIESMNAKFADEVIAANYDADRAIQQYGSTWLPSSSNSNNIIDEAEAAIQTSPCLGPRAHWMFCAQKYLQDTRPCDAYLAVLDKCVQNVILHKEHP